VIRVVIADDSRSDHGCIFTPMRPEFAAGARNAVRTCLNIESQDRVGIIRDRPRTHIAEAIEEEVRATGATVRVWTMEDFVSRPATSFPPLHRR
jgi:hypothetical protein